MKLGNFFFFRVIDVGSEWRTFEGNVNPSRVGGPENPLLNGSDLSTIIGGADATFNEFGAPKYTNRRNVCSSDRILLNGFKEIGEIAERINLPKTIVDRANDLFRVSDLGYL